MDATAIEVAARGILPPAATAAVFLTASWKPCRRPGVGVGPDTGWGPPLALGLGYAVGHVATHGWPPLSLDVGIKQGLFYVAVAAALYGLYEAARRPSPWARVVLALGLPFYLLDFMREHHWSRAESIGWTLGLGAGVFGAWSGLSALARRQPGTGLSLAWTAAAATASAALFLAGTASVAQLSGVLAAGLGVCALFGLRRPGLSLAPGGSTAFTLIYGGLLWAGHYSAELSAAATLLLALAPLAPAVALLPGPSKLHGVRAVVLRVALALAPALVAVALEYADRPPPNPYY